MRCSPLEKDSIQYSHFRNQLERYRFDAYFLDSKQDLSADQSFSGGREIEGLKCTSYNIFVKFHPRITIIHIWVQDWPEPTGSGVQYTPLSHDLTDRHNIASSLDLRPHIYLKMQRFFLSVGSCNWWKIVAAYCIFFFFFNIFFFYLRGKKP